MPTLRGAAEELLAFLGGVYDAADTEGFVAGLGYDFGPVRDRLNNVSAALSGLITVVSVADDRIGELVQALEEDDQNVADVVEKVRSVLTSIRDLHGAIKTAADSFGDPELAAHLAVVTGGAPLDDFLTEFADRLLGYLVVSRLEEAHPAIKSLLLVAGIIEIEEELADPLRHRSACRACRVNWGQIGSFLADPRSALASVIDWGGSNQNLEPLLDQLSDLLQTRGLSAGTRYVETNDLSRFEAILPSGLTNELPDMPALDVPILSQEAHGADLGVLLCALPEMGGVSSGLGLSVDASLSGTTVLALSQFLTVQIENADGLQAGMIMAWAPGQAPLFRAGLASSPVSGRLRLIASPGAAEPMVLLGTSTGSRFEIGALGGELGLELRGTEEPDLYGEASLTGCRIVINGGSGDGFLSTLFAGIDVDSRFDLTVGLSSRRGLYLRGSGGIEIVIWVHKKLGPLDIQSIYIGVALTEQGAIQVGLGISASATLGPIGAVVERVGARFTVTFPAGGGNIGPVDVAPSFLPPTGVGLSVAAGPVTGGGFIKHDETAGSYSGILDIKFSDIGLVAVAIITTKFPGENRPRYALFINIGVTFSPAITLPYNFNLQGCGGLCAVNRTMDTEALRNGLRNKTLNSILFPEDPILNASKIISDSEKVFPIQEGRFVVGPMAKLGWGAKGLVTANVAIVLELPAPIVIALLGQVKARVPAQDEAKVILNLDILGVLEIEKKSLSFDATLYDSKILVYDLSGDSAMRLRWGAQAQFALSIGGFHPKFNPPPKFPSLRRLTLALRSTSSFDLSCKVYHALTSNTLQFGARVEVHAEACGATLDGDLSFDTLFQFSPFEFEVAMSGGVSARFKGRNIASVRLSCDLSGPTPWHAKGKAEVSVLCWDVTARFNKTWGSDNRGSVEKIDPLDYFLPELSVVGNWSSAVPSRRTVVETLKSLDAPEVPPADSEPATTVPAPPRFLAHPAGTLEFRQRLLPLKLKLDKFKNVDVKGHFTFDVRLEVPTPPVPESTTPDSCASTTLTLMATEAKEDFARAQFKSLSKADRLSQPSFEKFRAGVRVGPSSARIDGCVQGCDLQYESILLMQGGVREVAQVASRDWASVRRGVAIGALRRAGIRHRRMGKFAVDGPARVGVEEESYVIVDKITLTRVTRVQPLDSLPVNRTMADQLLDDAVREGLVAAGIAMVVPAFEEVA